MSRRNEATEFGVNVCPIYDGEEEGELCAYACGPSLTVAMAEAGRLAAAWLAAPSDDDGDFRVVAGFEVVVSAPSFPDPI